MAICMTNVKIKYNTYALISKYARGLHECVQMKERFTEELHDLEWKTAKPYKEIPGKLIFK